MKDSAKNVNAIRLLSLDQITNAKSGHPGMVLSAAPVLYALFRDHMVLDSGKPAWFNRDRFVLSAGHGSSLLYSTLYAFGFNITMDDLKSFRKFGSKTPGHPELDLKLPIECATGALGQGVSMAVGMAMAEKHLAAVYNKPGLSLIDHYTYCLVGDGDLMEGVSYEVTELAGLNKLNKLILLYDSNSHTIEGETKIASLGAARARFEAIGFNVLEVADGNNAGEISKAIGEAKKSKEKPSIIIANTRIGFGSHLVDDSRSHGTPFTAQEVVAIRKNWNDETVPFGFPSEVKKECSAAISARSAPARKAWESILKKYKVNYKKEHKALFGKALFSAKDCLKELNNDKDMATRDAGHLVLNQLGKQMSNLFGGTADLAPATKAYLANEPSFSAANPSGRNIHFGVREHGMGSIMNGAILHGGITGYSSTFFVFSDYMRPSIRMSALMNIPQIYIFTHDSLFVGEDGPTHQPVEQLESLRIIPNFSVYRPCDLLETAACFECAVNGTKPSAIILSRQALPRLKTDLEGAMAGGYILSKESSAAPLNIVLVASGSEVSLALKVKAELVKKDYGVRVVSVPNRELFLAQDEKYKNSVIPKDFETILVLEAATGEGWARIAGKYGLVCGINEFGASGEGRAVYEAHGFSVQNITEKAETLIKRNKTIVKSVI